MKYKVGDKVKLKSKEGLDELKRQVGDLYIHPDAYKNAGSEQTILECNDGFYRYDASSMFWHESLFEGLVEEEMPLDRAGQITDFEYEGLTYTLPDGYIFKDQSGNEIHALKIVLEKANTLKKQSDNMETETHRGYYTTEEDNTNKSKKVAWFTFWDNDFADKVELDLSNRELIQEDGKWFVVKKKKEYPKSYEECLSVLQIKGYDIVTYVPSWTAYEKTLYQEVLKLRELIICRDAYWKIAGEEMGLGKPWEPDWTTDDVKHSLVNVGNTIILSVECKVGRILAFPSKEMRDTFYENFKELINEVKELL